MCVYCDTWDGNFLIGRHPDIEGLTVSTGGSGHAFKFAPVLGRLTADAMEGIANPYSGRFAWRPVGEPAAEGARYTGE
jgi:glycine/D-amino acid oxidase-like deaminating enzyme